MRPSQILFRLHSRSRLPIQLRMQPTSANEFGPSCGNNIDSFGFFTAIRHARFPSEGPPLPEASGALVEGSRHTGEVGRFNFLNIHGTLRVSRGGRAVGRAKPCGGKQRIINILSRISPQLQTRDEYGISQVRLSCALYTALYTRPTQQNIKLYHYPCKLKLPARQRDLNT